MYTYRIKQNRTGEWELYENGSRTPLTFETYAEAERWAKACERKVA